MNKTKRSITKFREMTYYISRDTNSDKLYCCHQKPLAANDDIDEVVFVPPEYADINRMELNTPGMDYIRRSDVPMGTIAEVRMKLEIIVSDPHGNPITLREIQQATGRFDDLI